ncbi:MAG: hypothetical protein ACRDQZ_18720 [Mycobacteriales bacterium]
MHSYPESQYPPPSPQRFGVPPPQSRRAWLWVLLTVTIVVVLAVGATLTVVLRGSDNNESKAGHKKPSRTGFQTSFEQKAPSYAGNPVYDACGLVTMQTVAKDIKGYRDNLNHTGSGAKQHLAQPMVIEHEYVDRDIPAPLGRDGQPHEPGIVIGAQGSQPQSLDSFTSLFDSNCTYSQGAGTGTTFAKVYVTQKPTPLSQGLLAYLGALARQGGKKQVTGVDVYTEPKPNSLGYHFAVVVKPDNSAAVFVKTGVAALTTHASEEAAAALAARPKGPVVITYPPPYQKLINPCPLINADDFTQYTQKPASALAQEKLILNEVGGPDEQKIERSCQRLEVDRFTNEIAESDVNITQWDSAGHAEQYVERFKAAPGGDYTAVRDTATPVGDQSYVKMGKDYRGREIFSFEFRIGAAVITLTVSQDQPLDALPTDYERRMTPVARKVADGYKQGISG